MYVKLSRMGIAILDRGIKTVCKGLSKQRLISRMTEMR